MATAGVDQRALVDLDRVILPDGVQALSAALKARTYHPESSGAASAGELTGSLGNISFCYDQIIKAGLTSLLGNLLRREGPCDADSRHVAEWVSRRVESGLTRVCTEVIQECLDSVPDEHILDALTSVTNEGDILGLLREVLNSAKTRESRALLYPLLVNLALVEVDKVVSQARAIGRSGSFAPVEAARFRTTIVMMSRPDQRYEWVLPACQSRINEELYKTKMETNKEASQFVDFTRGGSLRLGGFLLESRPSRGGRAKVQIRPIGAGNEVKTRDRQFSGSEVSAKSWLAQRRSVRAPPNRSPRTRSRGLELLATVFRRKRLFLLLGCIASIGFLEWYLFAPDAPQGAYALFKYDEIDDEHLGSMSYAVYVPPGYSRRERYPMVMFLHGFGERGADGRGHLTVGLAPFISSMSRSGRPVEFIALFPQSNSGGWGGNSPDGLLAMKVLERIQAQYRIDGDRIYLTGVSAGASGVWSLAAEYPNKWAAIVPLGGDADPAIAPSIKHIPCWCFHGTSDTTIDAANPRKMMAALREAGGNPIYTEYPSRGHDIWLKPYKDPKLREWLLAQRRPNATK